MMRKEYHYIGYVLYVLLFTAFFLSLIPGLMEILKRRGRHLENVVKELQAKACKVSIILWGLFFVTASLPILLYVFRSKGGYLFA